MSASGQEVSAPAELARAVERDIWRRLLLANLAAAALLIARAVASVIVTPSLAPPGPYPLRVPAAVNLVALLAYLVAVLGPSRALTRRLFAPVRDWVAAGRAPTRAEQEAVTRQPWVQALLPLFWWVGGMVWVPVLNFSVFYPFDIDQLLRGELSIVFGALVAGTFSYLLVERALRPVYALALADEGPAERRSGVASKMIFAWILGSGIYFTSIALDAVVVASREGTTAADVRSQLWFIVVISIMGLAVGAVLTVYAARAVSDPLRGLRAALGSVEQGDLDVGLPVDDGGEVGRVQSGFNKMVAGLRERRELEDLFGRHVGLEVSRLARDRGVGLGGETLDATVLFVDMMGSTRFTHERAPDEVVALLNTFFAAVVRTVGEAGGWVNQFQGDGALCVFGPPGQADGHPARALAAARRLRDGIGELARSVPGFDAAVGISSGEVVAGNVGAEQRYEYTVIGDASNEAVRLTDEAKLRPGRVLASEDAVRRAGAEAGRWAKCGTVVLRGRPSPTTIYEPASTTG